MRGVDRWTDPAWRSWHLAWARDVLENLGWRIRAEPEQRSRPWSTVFRIESDRGVVWSKANGPGAAHEGPLLAWLVERGETLPLAPLAVDPARGSLITPDGGPTLRATPTGDGRPGDQDLEAWSRTLPPIVDFQRRLTGAADELVALGVPDERPAHSPILLDAMLADDGIWERVDDTDRAASEAARRELAASRPLVAELAARLAASPVPVSLDHGDLHGNNILVGPDTGLRVFDWGDAVVAHPFATLTTTLGSIGHHLELDPYGPGVASVRDAYLAGWADLAPMTDLRALADVAMDLGHIGKAAAWERALTGLSPSAMAGFHGGTAAWLRDLATRLRLSG